MLIRDTEFDFHHHCYVMGILNVTPDSFSDGGDYVDPERALDRALQIQAEGAAFVDIGAESTRPGAQPIPVEEEARRLFPALKKIAPRIKIPISIDTRRAKIAEQALQEGADLVNDISAFRYDFRMAEVVAQSGAPCILMHLRGSPATMQQDVRYLNLVSEVIHFLKSQIDLAVRIGVAREQILVDPGLGFGKELGHNLELVRRLPELRVLEAPIVVGASRKSFIRRILQEADPTNPSIQTGSLAVATIACWNGASILRVHDIQPTVSVVRLVEALRNEPLSF